MVDSEDVEALLQMQEMLVNRHRVRCFDLSKKWRIPLIHIFEILEAPCGTPRAAQKLAQLEGEHGYTLCKAMVARWKAKANGEEVAQPDRHGEA